MKKIILILAFLSLAACNPSVSVGGDIANPGKSQTDYQGEKASGQINGIPWIFTSGTAKPLPNDPSRMFLTLQNQDFADLCAASSFTNTRVVTSVPAQVGETTLGMVGSSFETVTFSYPAADGNDAHLIASEGRIAITSITAEEVTGFIIARYNGANSINGAFKLKVCPK